MLMVFRIADVDVCLSLGMGLSLIEVRPFLSPSLSLSVCFQHSVLRSLVEVKKSKVENFKPMLTANLDKPGRRAENSVAVSVNVCDCDGGNICGM